MERTLKINVLRPVVASLFCILAPHLMACDGGSPIDEHCMLIAHPFIPVENDTRAKRNPSGCIQSLIKSGYVTPENLATA